jgi:hypothetical protein
MKIDDLHFRKYVPLLETSAFSGVISYTLASVAIVFSMNRILWAGILVLTIKVFHEKRGPWKTFFIVIGHVFIVSVVLRVSGRSIAFNISNLELTSENVTTSN